MTEARLSGKQVREVEVNGRHFVEITRDTVDRVQVGQHLLYCGDETIIDEMLVLGLGKYPNGSPYADVRSVKDSKFPDMLRNGKLETIPFPLTTRRRGAAFFAREIQPQQS